MSNAAAPLRMTATEYLAWEREQPERHELLDGEIFAMAGASPRHAALTAAIIRELGNALLGGPCHAFSADLRIVAHDLRDYVYPDVSVICGAMEFAPGTKDVASNPSIVIEVLSPSTERNDRGPKWDAYRLIPSLTDYVLVRQSEVQIEHFQRRAEGAWTYRTIQAGGQVTFANGASIAVDAVYRSAFNFPGE
jgi:Uma2 family endonuclease